MISYDILITFNMALIFGLKWVKCLGRVVGCSMKYERAYTFSFDSHRERKFSN